MSESRQELINWVNDLLLLNISKVEQCGTGAIFCQIFDSIYMDLPMSKVRFDVNSEYQYLNNFKVLQAHFTRYRIDRSIPVERLVKCRFQDNLEFLQWMRRFWDSNFPGHEYDPVARRKGPIPASIGGAGGGGGGGGSAAGHRPPPSTTAANTALNSQSRSIASGASRPRPAPTQAAAVNRPSSAARGPAAGAGSAAALQQAREKVKTLEEENGELVSAVELVESERDFYFQKLRDIEVLIQNAADQLDPENNNTTNTDNNLDDDMNKLDIKDNKDHAQLIREIQTVLYSTAEGFEIPTQEYETEETF